MLVLLAFLASQLAALPGVLADPIRVDSMLKAARERPRRRQPQLLELRFLLPPVR